VLASSGQLSTVGGVCMVSRRGIVMGRLPRRSSA
jgi:hypothetical protein